MSVYNLTETEGRDQFYPTPGPLIDKMLEGLDWDYVNCILEPSAGKGDLAKACAARMKAETRRYRHAAYNGPKPEEAIDCIEIDRNLRHILRGEGFRVVHDDFLTFRGLKTYSLILMNPPFREGEKHLLHALELQRRGGTVICLLNAETLKNPFTATRQLLLKRLDEYNAQIDYIADAFRHAERTANVEVALVKVSIEWERRPESEFFSGMDAAEPAAEFVPEASSELAERNFLTQIVRRYHVETRAGLKLIREYIAMLPYLSKTFKTDSMPILNLVVDHESTYGGTGGMENKYLRFVRRKYWTQLFDSEEFIGKLTSGLRDKFRAMVDRLADYDFTLFNIEQIAAEMNVGIRAGIEDSILQLFDELTFEHSWYPECAKNRHYFSGWASNKAHMVNKKCVLPVNGMFSQWSWDKNTFSTSKAFDVISDLEKALNYLDGHMTAPADLRATLDAANAEGRARNIECRYFKVDLYKKGTMHVRFTNLALLERLNIYAARRRGWLPPCYGRKAYRDMEEAEKAVVDDFQGEEAYARVLEHAAYYLAEPAPDRLRLGPG